MPAKKTSKSTARKSETTEQKVPAGEEVKVEHGTFTAPGEEYLSTWVNFAKELGETTTESIKRFGEEQQRLYERWSAAAKDVSQPRPTQEDLREVTARYQEWTHLAEEVGQKVADALTTGSNVQKDLFTAWSRTAVPPTATETLTPEQQARNATELVQKFWRDVLGNVSERYGQAFRPGLNYEDFVKTQEQALREFSENFRKLSYSYLTSPNFVTLFGRTLDSALEAQKSFAEQGGLASIVGSLPTRDDISELRKTLKALSEKVNQLEEKIR